MPQPSSATGRLVSSKLEFVVTEEIDGTPMPPTTLKFIQIERAVPTVEIEGHPTHAVLEEVLRLLTVRKGESPFSDLVRKMIEKGTGP